MIWKETSKAIDYDKLQEIESISQGKELSAELQNMNEDKDGVAQSIKIIAFRGLDVLLHYTVGYPASSLLEALRIFEGSIGSEVAAFADSFVDVKIYFDRAIYSNQSDSIEVNYIWDWEDRSKEKVLETFPIFSVTLDFSEHFRPITSKLGFIGHEFYEIPGPNWPFSGWSLQQHRAAFEASFKRVNKKRDFFHSVNLRIQN